MTGADAQTQRAVSRCKSQLPETIGGDEIVFGLDGVVDTVREVVDERHGAGEYTRVSELSAISERIDESVEMRSSATFEWTAETTRTGGHVCHLTRALGALDYRPTMVGTFGDPVKPVFRQEFGEYSMASIGRPGHTDAVEFDDGKLLLTEPGAYRALDWETLCERVDVSALADRVDGKRLLGLGYWSVIPSFPDILDGLLGELWPRLSSPPEHVLVDPADLRHIPRTDLEDGASALAALDDVVPVTVSANRTESQLIAALFDDSVEKLEPAVDVAREGLGVSRFVGHGVERAASATRGASASVAVPRVDDPVLTTSAGDHFNAGLVVGLLAGVDEDAALVLGNAVAGSFVRNGTGPTPDELRSFVETYSSRFD